MDEFSDPTPRTGGWRRRGTTIILDDPFALRREGLDPDLQAEFESFDQDFIRWVQRSLNQILGTNVNVDGLLGPETRSAVRTFQQHSGVQVDGIPGPQTTAALRSSLVAPCANVRQPCETLDNFEFDVMRVLPAHQLKILHIARCVIASQGTARPIRSLRVVGHTDSEGSTTYNNKLGFGRATEVVRQLVLTLNRLKPGSAATITMAPETRGESDPVSPNPAKNRRVVVCLPHCTCNGFFREYDLISSPSTRFGVPTNERMSQSEKDQRNRDVETMVEELIKRRDRRARDALAGRIPAPAPIAAGLAAVAKRLSDAQLNLFRECFRGSSSVIDFAHFADCFERFANGELRDPVTGGGVEGVGEPEGGFFFLFAEFAFLCIDSKIDDWLWKDILRVFVMTQEIFMHVYRADRRAPAPPVSAPLPARGPATRDLDAGFGFRSFNLRAQSDDARKAALRAKYAASGVDDLRAAARDILLRAQRMP